MIEPQRRLKVAFISPVFLFPADAGGKIRTGNILRGLKESGQFDLTLLSPATAEQQREWQGELDKQCERFIGWTPTAPHASNTARASSRPVPRTCCWRCLPCAWGWAANTKS